MSGAARLKDQNEQIVTFTLVELLTQLVFVAMLLAVVLRDEVTQRFADPAREIAELKRDNAGLRKKLAESNRLNAYLQDQLAQRPPGSQASNDVIVVPRSALTKFLDWQDRQGQGGSDLPPCAELPGAGYALEVRFVGGGFQGRWLGPAALAPDSIPGMAALVSGQTLTTKDFRAAASSAQAWGKKHSPPCGLRAMIKTGAMIDKAKQNIVRLYFYEATS